MTCDEFNDFCRGLPATTTVVQWGGAHVWKVGGKVFAFGYWDEDEPAIRALFPAAELITIPEGSHWLHVDAEEALCRHLREYLQC